MKLVIDRYVHEPPGIAIIPETEFEAAVLSRYWKTENMLLSKGRAKTEDKSSDGFSYGIKFREVSS